MKLFTIRLRTAHKSFKMQSMHIISIFTFFCLIIYSFSTLAGGHDGGGKGIQLNTNKIALADDYFNKKIKEDDKVNFVPDDATLIDFNKNFKFLEQHFRFISKSLKHFQFKHFIYSESGWGNPIIKTPYSNESKPDFLKFNFYYVDKIPAHEDCQYEYSQKVINQKTFPIACTARNGKDILLDKKKFNQLIDFDMARIIYHELFRTIRPKIPTVTIVQIIKGIKVLKDIHQRQLQKDYSDISYQEYSSLVDTFQTISSSTPNNILFKYTSDIEVNRKGGGLQKRSQQIDETNYIGVFSYVGAQLGTSNIIIGSKIYNNFTLGNNNLLIDSTFYGEEGSKINNDNTFIDSHVSRAEISINNDNNFQQCTLEGLNKSSSHYGVIYNGSGLSINNEFQCQNVELHFDHFYAKNNSKIINVPLAPLKRNDYIFYDNVSLFKNSVLFNINFTNRIERKGRDFFIFEKISNLDWELKNGLKRNLTIGRSSQLLDSSINYLNSLYIAENTKLSNIKIPLAKIEGYNDKQFNINILIEPNLVLENLILRTQIDLNHKQTIHYYFKKAKDLFKDRIYIETSNISTEEK